uniref:Uncharacterized protein n=1 Tax=Nymphaea colorata TaxID=210225 RepID=A0A5K0WGY7_9MAGN
MTAAAPSAKRAKPTRPSGYVPQGPWNVTATISQHTTNTLDPLLFSAKSLAMRKTALPAKQPW